jgi:hypothetical protein
VSRVRLTLQVLIQTQFSAHRTLDRGNPNLANIRKDFERFGFSLDLAAADPANVQRLAHLAELNKWRKHCRASWNAHLYGGSADLSPVARLEDVMQRTGCLT